MLEKIINIGFILGKIYIIIYFIGLASELGFFRYNKKKKGWF